MKERKAVPKRKTITVKREVLVCPKCGAEIQTRTARPVRCARCQTRFTHEEA